MPFGQLLHRQRRTEIRIALANQRQHRATERFAMFAIARTATLARRQSRCAIGLKGTTEAKNLASAKTHQRASRRKRETTIRQVDHHTQSGQLPIAHLDHRHRTSPRTSRRQLAPVTFLSGTRVTFLSVTYNWSPNGGGYGTTRLASLTGLRAAELADLRIRDLVEDRTAIAVPGGKTRNAGSVRPRAKTTATSNFCDGPAGEGGHLPTPAPADT